MKATLRRDDAPGHLFDIPELDFSGDLFGDPLPRPWFILGAQTFDDAGSRVGVAEGISRQSVLIAPHDFVSIFDKLESVGNVFQGLGKPSGVVRGSGSAKDYSYAPFHRFEFPFTGITAEPLVFLHSDTSGVAFLINPDLWMFFALEEKTAGSGIWWDPRRGEDVLIRRSLDDGQFKTVEIRTDYLLKYLRARQRSLMVGHYRHLHFFDPPKEAVEAFVREDIVMGSPEQGAKAIFQNWGLRQGFTERTRFLQRRLHLWFEIRPPALNSDDPFAEPPPFDPYSFTLPTAAGPVAPARWKHLRHCENETFAGRSCDFMDRVYFRQEVLGKYEGAAGYDVRDDGSVSCRHYWGLVRSTSRLGNELLSTAIGDFAEGVPFEEWPHWKQHAVEPPMSETIRALAQEMAIPQAVNIVADALGRLNAVFARLAGGAGAAPSGLLWRGSLESLAGRQLKWVYPARADDDEFLKRSTLASTLFLDGLQPAAMRSLLGTLGRQLHRSFDKKPQPLGSRTLLQRVALAALLIHRFRPDLIDLPLLVHQAEGKAMNAASDLQAELEQAYRQVRVAFAPLAFLYDLRTHGGLAHPPAKAEAAGAAASLGLPRENWHRTDYLQLLKLVAGSLDAISEQLEAAAETLVAATESDAYERRGP